MKGWKDLMRVIALVILLLAALASVGGCANEDYAKTPLFFVHGHGMPPESFNAMIAYLEKSGYPRLYLRTIALQPNNGANIPAAERQIRPAIDQYLSEINEVLKRRRPEVHPKTKVDLLSHSMGALSTRWYAAKLHPERVRVWLSLAGASHGSDVGCSFHDPGGDDVCPAYAGSERESYVQFHLNGKPRVPDVDETPYGIGTDSPGVRVIAPLGSRRILYVTIRTTPDIWLVPEDTAVVDGAGAPGLRMPAGIQVRETSPGNYLMTNRIDHDAVLSDGDSLKLVQSILEQADGLLGR
jgi:pimeloyl-ACP methyl ester carboxylesterase